MENKKETTERITWKVNGDTVTVSGTGVLSKDEWRSLRHIFDSCVVTALVVDNGVTGIKQSVFDHCRNITSIMLPASVTEIHAEAFDECENLLEIQVAADNPVYASQDGVLYNRTTGVLVRYPRGRQGACVIPDGVTGIGEKAFSRCEGMTSLGLPDSVTNIGEYAFKYCCCLTSIHIPDSVTEIGKDALCLCCSLTSIHIPAGVTGIEEGTFCGCRSLTSILIPKHVTRVKKCAFLDCKGLTSIMLPDRVTEIEYDAFMGCSSLTSIIIPNSVTVIGTGAFMGCSSLTSITVPDRMTVIDGGTFMECSSLTSITVPDSVTSIGGNAFRYCHGLTSITIPAGVTDIGITAFSDCNSLLEINVETDNPAYTSEDGILFNRTRDTLLQCPAGKQGDYIIPDSVTCIGESAFSSCSALTSIAIPDSVTNIPEDGDKNLCYPGNNSLNRIFRCKALRAIHVAADNPVYASHDGLLFDKAKDTLLLCPCGKQGACVIPDSVTRIGNSAFSSCNSLTSITIPDSVTAIDRYVFFNCTGLTSIRIPAGVTDISLDAFNNCDLKIEVAPDNPVYASVDGVILNKEKTAITHFPSDRKGPYAVPDGVTVIGDYNFGPCFGLMSVTIPASVTHIVENCFFFSSCGFASGDLTLTLLGHTPPSLSTEESPVSGLSRDTPVFVPAAAVETYRLAKGWNKFSNIRPIPEMGNETYR